MSRVMIRYVVRPEHVERNEALVRAVYDELRQTGPAGFRYVTFRLGDGGEFVHLASNETAGGRSPLPDLSSFRAFQDGIAERCEVPPVVSELHEIGSYRVWSTDAD
jgi:hypothetical protein